MENSSKQLISPSGAHLDHCAVDMTKCTFLYSIRVFLNPNQSTLAQNFLYLTKLALHSERTEITLPGNHI